METREAHPLPGAYWVEPDRFLAGEYPGSPEDDEARAKIRRLLQAGVSCFLDLTEEGEIQPYLPIAEIEAAALGRRIEHRRRPIRDFSVPSPEQLGAILAEIEALTGAGAVVYLHCWGGVGRTGTVVGCYLVRGGRSGAEAIARIAALRAGTPGGAKRSPETEAQRAVVLGFR